MATLRETDRGILISLLISGLLALSFAWTSSALALEPLLIPLGQPSTNHLRHQVVAAQRVRVNPRALQSPVISIELMGETVIARRDSERHEKGLRTWVGHLEGQPLDRVVVTSRGRAWSALIQRGAQSFQLGLEADGQNRLEEWMPEILPDDDAADLPDGGGTSGDGASVAALPDLIEQDLLVVYTQAACYFSGSCDQLEADIVTAVADLNATYRASGVHVNMTLVGLAKTAYEGVDAGEALKHLSGRWDGHMDEVHALRDETGADLVSLVYDGGGCGIGYVNASAEKAFNVTDVPCLLANRSLAHEIAHNQGANHDRVTLGTPSVTTFNYGYRRCDDMSAADFSPAPHFRTIMSYGCGSTPRRGIFSSPTHFFEGVAQGIDPAEQPSRGTDNARRLNERAAEIAAFRARPGERPPVAPESLKAEAVGADVIRLSWIDRASNERNYVIQVSAGERGTWTTVAMLAADSDSWTHGGLQAETVNYYRVFALNAAGSSEYSRVVVAETESPPRFVDHFALADLPGVGQLSGDYRQTHGDDRRTEVLVEEPGTGSGKKKSMGFSHAWEFDIDAGSGGVVVNLQAWVTGREGALFWYSTDDGVTRNPMLTVNHNAPDAPQSFVLPADTRGRLRIGVSDAERQDGESADSVLVDEIVIRSWDGQGQAPSAPETLAPVSMGAASVTLGFTGRSAGEWGFEVWRSTDPVSDCVSGQLVGSISAGEGLITFTDVTARPRASYWYSVTAFNGAGRSDCAAPVPVVTLDESRIKLQSATPFRVKGKHHVTLEFESESPVDIYRDGYLQKEALEGRVFNDPIGAKGRASYAFWICETGTAICSESLIAEF